MKYLFLDESGDHDLINIDKKYPIFVLAGCIIDVKNIKLSKVNFERINVGNIKGMG